MQSQLDSLTQPVVQFSPQLYQHAIALYRLDSSLDIQTQNRICINYIALGVTLQWFEEEMTAYPGLFHHWKQVDGSAVLLTHSQKTAIVVPSSAIDGTEMKLSDYWVKHSNHRGDYFLFVQINVDEQWLKFWGYTSCKLLKQANHHPTNGIYTIRSQDLIQDISVFSVVSQICPNEVTV